MIKRSLFNKVYSLFYNPVLYKEMSIGLRDRRIFIIQTIYLTILTIALFVVLIQSMNSYYSSSADIGKNIFYALFTIQFLLVILIAPALTCGSISTEKEKKTYELLIGTLLSPSEIISGKLLHGISHIFLLLVSSLPLTATVFFLGGVSPGQLIAAYLAIFATGFFCCQIGQFFSVREVKTANATNQSYLMIILFCIGFFPVLGVLMSLSHGSTGSPLTYRSVHFPLWIYFGVNFFVFSGFIFAKTINYISNEAKNILYMSKFFILGYVFNLIIFSAIVANEKPSAEDTGIVLTLIAVANLFFLGFFGSPSSFSSQRELSRYSKSPVSRPYYFPAFFAISFIIPGLFFLLELPPASRPLLFHTLYFNGFYLLGFFVASRILFNIFRQKLPFAFFYYLMLIAFSFLPYMFFIRDTQVEKVVPFTSFMFLSPPIVSYSLWKPQGYPGAVDFFALQIPLPLFSILSYLFILILLGIIYLHFSRNGRHMEPLVMNDNHV